MRGRKPKPTWQKKLEGNRGKRALNADEPQVAPLSDAEMAVPPELADMPIAAEHWRRLVPLLQGARAVTAADRSALIAVCLEWTRYLEAMRHVKRTGMVVTAPSGYPMTNPYLGIANKALNACLKLWPELGLTPSSRSRLHTDSTGPVDEFSEFDQAPLPTPAKDVH